MSAARDHERRRGRPHDPQDLQQSTGEPAAPREATKDPSAMGPGAAAMGSGAPATAPTRARLDVTALGHLAAAMAHEVRNPLNAMAIHAELLTTRIRRLGTDAEPLARSVAVIGREVGRIDAILERYLEWAGPPEIERRPVDIAALLRAAAARIEPTAAARRVHVRVTPPASDAPGTWPIDAAALGVVIDAGLTNAVEASLEGGEVTLRATVEGQSGVVEIIDRGTGMTADQGAQVFHLGFSTRPGHAGVGLTVAKQIIKAHEGSIQLRSEGPERGATLHIELPLDAPLDASA